MDVHYQEVSETIISLLKCLTINFFFFRIPKMLRLNHKRRIDSNHYELTLYLHI